MGMGQRPGSRIGALNRNDALKDKPPLASRGGFPLSWDDMITDIPTPLRPLPMMMADPPARGGDNGGHDDGSHDDDGSVGVVTRTRVETKKPSQYKVLMLNDDYTPMEFVVMVLQRFFKMDIEQATRVMLHVHQRGVGVCGIFSLEVAETKVNQVMDCARTHQHPLQCALEKA
jgi:ATP-dependent Clp protease adaptor protein ClpS